MRPTFRSSTLCATTIAFALSGCGPTLIVDQKAGAGLKIGSLSFSGDGKQLAYAAADWNKGKKKKGDDEGDDETQKGGNFQLTPIPPAGKPKLVSVESCAAGNAYRLRWAHKEKKMAVAARDALMVLTPKGKKFTAVELITSQKSCEDADQKGDIQSLAWSPDDAQIVFSRGGELFTIPSDGGDAVKIEIPTLTLAENERLTLLEWSEHGWVIKKGGQIVSVSPDSKEVVVKHELGEKDDWVATSPKGAVYVVTTTGQVQEIRPGGPKTVLTLKPLLAAKAGKKKSPVRHKYVIEVSPSGKLLAVAESLADKNNSGSSILSLVTLPGAKGKDKEGGKGKSGKKKAAADEGGGDEGGEAAASEGEGGGDEGGGDEGEGKKSKKKKAAAGDEGGGDEGGEAAGDEDGAKPKKQNADKDDPQ